MKVSLAESTVVGFIPSTDLNVAREFYSDVLGLELSQSDEYALEYRMKGAKLRVAKVNELSLKRHTIFGWEVADIDHAVASLAGIGVRFERFDGMSQNEQGVCSFPGGGKVAWFRDPEGNTLSITQVGSESQG